MADLTLKGTVAEYDWGNPHVVVLWDVKDDAGKVTRWSGELASVSSMLADGMTKTSLKPGDDVIMTVHPAKSGSPQSVAVRPGNGRRIAMIPFSPGPHGVASGASTAASIPGIGTVAEPGLMGKSEIPYGLPKTGPLVSVCHM